MINANKIKNLITEQTMDDRITSMTDDIFLYFKHKFQQAGGIIKDKDSSGLHLYADFLFFYPNLPILQKSERKKLELKFIKKFSREIKKSKLIYFSTSSYCTLYVLSLSSKFYFETYFNDKGSILEINFNLERPDEFISASVYFAPGISVDHEFRYNLKLCSPDIYDLILQEIKSVIDITAKALRTARME